mgnify:CR=1 FL=1
MSRSSQPSLLVDGGRTVRGRIRCGWFGGGWFGVVLGIGVGHPPGGQHRRQDRGGQHQRDQQYCNAIDRLRVDVVEIGQADELRYSRAFVEAERGLAEQLRQELFALAEVSSDSATPQAVESIYNEQSLLKRWTWRLGLIAAATVAQTTANPPLSLAA